MFGNAQGSFVHCVWECNIIRDFWVEVINITKIILSLNIPLDAKMILLHLYPKNLKLNSQQRKFIDFAILQAKRVIASWKRSDPPVIGAWIKAMVWPCMALEKITYFIKNKLDVYEEIWNAV